MVDVIPVNAQDDVLVPLAPMDATMNTLRVAILYIYPPPSSSTASYDLARLEQSFLSLVDEDYPVLIGKLDVNPQTGVASVRQTLAAREQGARGIRFEKDPASKQTAEDVLASLSWDFMPKVRGEDEIIAVKGTLLANGGMTVGVDCNHILFDGEAMFTFMKTWSQHYNGLNKHERLVICHERHLLAGEGEGPKLEHSEFRLTAGKLLARAKDGTLAPKAMKKPPPTTQHIFHMPPANMAALKKAVSGVSDPAAPGPTYSSTVDAITALFTVLISRARGHGQDVRISTALNGRKRLDPPLPDNYAGNAVFHTMSTYSKSDLQLESDEEDAVSLVTISRIARGIRASILERDNAYLRDAIAFVASQSDLSTVSENIQFFFGTGVAFTCWANLGMYDAEFEGTRPWYAFAPRVPCMDGFVMITEAMKGRDGLDVLVFLECAAMEKLKKLAANVSYLQDKDFP
ncbi:hypothetical protein BBJ28_00005975 [Nothophytophthora sp. Chile5]|nr:hypothetical protein BBJ28_00005975 [Nothophytophthora sp. Chile5]